MSMSSRRIVLALMLWLAPAAVAAAAPAITSVQPDTVTVRAGGRPVSIMLRGTDLADIDAIVAVKDGHRVDGVSIELRAPGKDSRRAAITADDTVKPGSGYQLRAMAGRRAIAIPLGLDVVGARDKAAGDTSPTRDADALTRREPARRETADAAADKAAPPTVQGIAESDGGYVIHGTGFGATARGTSVYQCSTADVGQSGVSELPAQCKVSARKLAWKSASEIEVLDAPGGNVFVQVVTAAGRSKIFVGALYPAPSIESHGRTATGYAILGSGFGSRGDLVTVYEAETRNLPAGQQWTDVPERFRIDSSRVTVTPRRIDVKQAAAGTYIVQVKVRNAKTKVTVVPFTPMDTTPVIEEIVKQPSGMSVKGKHFVGTVRVFVCRGGTPGPTLPDSCLVPERSVGVYPTNLTVLDMPSGQFRVQVESNGVRSNVMAETFQWTNLEIIRVEKTTGGYALVGRFGTAAAAVRVYQQPMATIGAGVNGIDERYRVTADKVTASEGRVDVRDRPLGQTMIQVRNASGASNITIATLYQPSGPPRITRILKLAPGDGIGYQIEGSGFGYDAKAVTIVENGTTLPATVVNGMLDTYINVCSAPVGTFTVKVRVAGVESGSLATNLGFTASGPTIRTIETRYSPYGQIMGYDLVADGIDRNRTETLVVYENGTKLTGTYFVQCGHGRETATNCVSVANRNVRGLVRHQAEYAGHRGGDFTFTHPDKGWLPPKIYEIVDGGSGYEIRGFAFGDSADAITVYENGVAVPRVRIDQVWGPTRDGQGQNAARIFVNKTAFQESNRSPVGAVQIKMSLEGQESAEKTAVLGRERGR